MKFYNLREMILWGTEPTEALKCLCEMEAIVRGEINRSLQMIDLCRFDSRLGFHSEAEGYKYYPEKLLWRIKQLESLLENDFPRMRIFIKSMKEEELLRMTTPVNAPVYKCSDLIPAKGNTFEWTAKIQGKVLHINVACNEIIHDSSNTSNSSDNNIIEDRLFIHIKAGDLGYPYNFSFNLKSQDITSSSKISRNSSRKAYSDTYIGFPINCFYEVKQENNIIIASFEIDLEKMPGYRGQSALAISIVRNLKTTSEEIQDIWSGENPHIRHRLCLSNYNPETMGRLELA